jgi:hypothetical protein
VNLRSTGRRDAQVLSPLGRIPTRNAGLLALAAASIAALAWNQRPAADVEQALGPAMPMPIRAEIRPNTQPRASAAPAEPIAAEPASTPPAAATTNIVAETPELAISVVPLAERVMFLTIVGSETFIHWGRIGDRPPRVDASGALAFAAASPGAEAPATAVTETSDASVYGGSERPYGPAPQECPRTLPPGSDQRTADDLKRQAGCRYLSSCDAENQCSWYYQGRD